MRGSVFVAAAMAVLAPLSALAQSSSLPTAVDAQELHNLDAWSVSAFGRSQGALAPDLWAHSDAAAVAELFGRLPAVYQSPAAQRIAQRVLFSGGAAPPTGDAHAAVQERFEALGRMGAADQLATMAAGAPDAIADATIAQYAAQAELARGRRPEACARGRGPTLGDHPPIFLVRLRAYCSAAGGDRAAADLALEMGHGAAADDAWYRAAIAAIAGAPSARPPAARYDNALATAISLAAHLRPAAHALNTASTLALLALAHSDAAPQPERAQAAAAALRRAALSPAEAHAILAATPDTVTTGAPALLVALRRLNGASDAGQAAAIAAALHQADGPAEFTAVARFFRAEINDLTSAPDANAAVLLARAALTNGDAQDARRLIASARQAGASEATMGPLDAALVALSGASGGGGTMALKRRIDAAGASMARAAARDIALLVALGAQPDEATQTFLAATPTIAGAAANAATLNALADAVQQQATGEVGLLASLALHPRPDHLDVASLSEIITALRTAGFESDARRVAVEAILAGEPAAATPARRPSARPAHR